MPAPIPAKLAAGERRDRQPDRRGRQVADRSGLTSAVQWGFARPPAADTPAVARVGIVMEVPA